MKNLVAVFIAFALFALPAAARAQSGAGDAAPVPAAETLAIAADIWCPYNCEPDSAKPGFMVEILREIFKKHGITVKYVNIPWSRAIEETRQAKYNAIIGGIPGDAPDFIYPELPLGKSETAFFVKKGNPWRYEGIENLSAISMGGILDYSYGEDLDKYIAENKGNLARVQLVSGDNALAINLKKLISGRVDAIIDDSDVLSHYVSQNPEFQDKVEKAGSYSVDDIYAAFSPNHPQSQKYVGIFTAGLKELRASGDLQKIMERYSLSDFAPRPAVQETPAAP